MPQSHPPSSIPTTSSICDFRLSRAMRAKLDYETNRRFHQFQQPYLCTPAQGRYNRPRRSSSESSRRSLQAYPLARTQEKSSTNLKVAPLAAVPHKSRDFRMILDISFQLQQPNTGLYNSVNSSDSTQNVPHHSQAVRSNVIPRIPWTMDRTKSTEPFLFAKVDIKDGF
jgi:hypothetical protein